MIKFGPAGNSNSFYNDGYIATVDAALWLKNRGLDLFEYSFGRGITLSNDTATSIGKAFKDVGIELSAHAPYYINFGNPDEIMIEKSIKYVTNSLLKLNHFGGNRLVVHTGSFGKRDKEECFNEAMDNLKKLKDEVYEKGLENHKICFETMGKQSQIGSLEEIITICNIDKCFYPCIDFGHLNCRSLGTLKTKNDYEEVIRKLLDGMESQKVINMHVHFSKIEFGQKGEVKHLTFDDNIYGPSFEPLAEILIKYNLNPYIVCESDGTQAEDALFMKNYYNSLLK